MNFSLRKCKDIFVMIQIFLEVGKFKVRVLKIPGYNFILDPTQTHEDDYCELISY